MSLAQTILDKLQAVEDATNYACRRIDRVVHLLEQQSPRLRISSITVTQPNGDTQTMSGTQPTTLPPVTIYLPDVGSTQSPGYATFPITLSNSDGTAPTMTPASNIIVTTAITGPNPDGSYTGVVTAAPGAAGQSTNVNISADGVVDVVIPFMVVANPAEIASVDPTKIVVSPPGSPAPSAPAAQVGTTQTVAGTVKHAADERIQAAAGPLPKG